MDFDLTNLAVQMTMPNNKVIADDDGKPSIYVYFPKGKLSDVLDTTDNSTHPAFIVNGTEIDGFWLGKYLSTSENGKLYSLPARDPANGIQNQNFATISFTKGVGHHEATAAEYAWVALWCKKNGFLPKGNNNFGKDASENSYIAVPTPNVKDSGRTARTLTGTGPVSWSHDGTVAGVYDLNGDVWEATMGIRLVYGELQVLVNNNAADVNNPTNETSAKWQAINASTGEYMAPENSVSDTLANTYAHSKSVKLSWTGTTFQWVAQLSASLVSGNQYALFANVTASDAIGYAAKLKLRALALLPESGATSSDYGDDGFWANTQEAERFCWRGDSWGGGSSAGVFNVNFNDPRSVAGGGDGGRLAYIENLPSE